MIYTRLNTTTSHFFVQFTDSTDKKAGVYLIEEKENEKTGATYTRETYICTLLTVDEKIKSESAIYYRVTYYDNNEPLHKYIKASDLLADGLKDSDDFKHIVNNGLIITSSCRKYVIEYLKCVCQTLENKKGTDKSGWTKDFEYISNGLNTSDIVYTGRTSARFEVAGSQAQYLQKIGQVFQENPLVFAICSYCASGFILRYLRNEINQILALTGVSSKGKSTVGKLALSMFTHPRYFRGMDATKLGMQYLAREHNDNFIFFDENQESNLTAEQRLQFVYSLANASERLRASKFSDGTFGTKEQEEHSKYAVLIAGEKSFIQGVKSTGTGLDARFLEIVLPESIPLWDSITTSEEAESLNQFILDNHGHIALPFIEYVKQNHKTIVENYDRSLKVIRNELGDVNAITLRKARILAYTLETARILSLLIYGNELANEMADEVYKALKYALFASPEKESYDVYKEHLSHIENTQSQYFEIMQQGALSTEREDDRQIIRDYCGQIIHQKEHKEIKIISTKLTDVCIRLGIDEKLLLAYAQEKHLLEHDKDSLTKKVKIKGVRARYYVLRIPHSFFVDDVDKQQEQQELDEIADQWSKKN